MKNIRGKFASFAAIAVDAGVCAIFMTPVEWDTSRDGVRIAAAAAQS